MLEPEILLRDLGIPESPRWHEGRPRFRNWIDRQVVAVGLDGKPEVMVTRDLGSHPRMIRGRRKRRRRRSLAADRGLVGQPIGWPSPTRFPSLSRNHAARSPLTPVEG